ncbi:MAG: hypothetical protein JKY94_07975 [Rhodobacteraceae bacterium]|nr:hypothetical protein [Paracoccaceae bacterium]
MPVFKFYENFDFSPKAKKGSVTIAYKAGMTKTVTAECAAAANAAGKGEKIVAKVSDVTEK